MVRNDINHDEMLCFASLHLGLPTIYVRGYLSLSCKNAKNKFCVNLCSSGLCNTFFLSFFLSFFPLHYLYKEKEYGVSTK